MAGFARQAVILSLSRIANYGLMIISPIILVRVLTVGEFGHYREFLLYASLVQSIASFGIADSLLYFIPAHAASSWRVVRQTAILTAAISVCIVLSFYCLDFVLGRSVLGQYAMPVTLYVLLFVNVDFWEYFWLATHRTGRVFVYTFARLVVRMLVVVGVAVATHDVTTIIWSLIALEAIRCIAFGAIWAVLDRSRHEPELESLRRDQLRFCIPVGLASILFLISRNLGNVVVTKWLGAAALAQLTIGTYGEPIIMAVRNSISNAMLPELVRRGGRSSEAPMELWHRATVINCVLLFPAAVLLVCFAEPLVLKVFGPKYAPAVPVLRVYALVIVAACFDFSLPLRAKNQTRPLVTSNLIAALATGSALVFLLPVAGLVGAALTLVVSSLVEGFCRAWSVRRLYGLTLRELLPWARTGQVALCAGAAIVPVAIVTWKLRPGLLGVVAGSAIYLAVFASLLMLSGVEEAITLAHRLRNSLSAAAFGGR